MNEIKNKITNISLLKEQLSDIEIQLKEIIFNTIREVAKSQSVNKINKHIVIVKFSDLCNYKKLNPLHYNWECSADVLFNMLKNKSGMECYNFLMKMPELPDSKINGISKDFILKIIEKLK